MTARSGRHTLLFMQTTVPAKNTPAFYVQSIASFGVSLVAVGLGIAYLPVEPALRAFLAIGTLYLVTSAFTLAKCVRDQQEERNVISRVDQVRLEKLLAEYDPYHGTTTAGGSGGGQLHSE